MLANKSTTKHRKVRDFVDKGGKLASWFTPDIHQDAQEFVSFLLEKICQEIIMFKFVRHSLFTIYGESFFENNS